MKELLKKLLEAEVLSEDTKVELEEAFKVQIDEAIEAAKVEVAAETKAELAEQWLEEKNVLIEAVDTKLSDILNAEMNELKEDLEHYRDLEVKYAEKLVQEKEEMAANLQTDLQDLVEMLDSFLEVRIVAEMDELKDDIEEQKRNDFGRKIFEAVVDEYMSNFADEDSAKLSLRETQESLDLALESVEDSEAKIAKLERKIKMDELLSPLNESQKELMETLLRGVGDDKLDEGYNTFIARVLKDGVPEKENEVLAEDVSDDVSEEVLEETTVILEGNSEEVLEENNNVDHSDYIQRMRKLGGVVN